MTEWAASEYARLSALQEAMAQEALALLDLKGNERVLDVGCGNGRVTSKIAACVPQGAVLGVDPSADMIAFASSRFVTDARGNLRFEVTDARKLPFREEFDLIVSFNALHWVPEQDKALRSIRSAMKANGLAPNGHSTYRRRNGSPLLPMYWIAIRLWRQIDQTKRIFSSFTRWT